MTASAGPGRSTGSARSGPFSSSSFLPGCCCATAGRAAAGWNWPQQPAPESARDILDKRYARGEITKEQYEAMKRDLTA
ncbi:MAG: SHOCT domain-containing protein [Methylobacteriaceae bacterium]|nr:SHOCT domain-containing protein [Methylobacteriaceae bacterium]